MYVVKKEWGSINIIIISSNKKNKTGTFRIMIFHNKNDNVYKVLKNYNNNTVWPIYMFTYNIALLIESKVIIFLH